jgi:hypothetical protein
MGGWFANVKDASAWECMALSVCSTCLPSFHPPCQLHLPGYLLRTLLACFLLYLLPVPLPTPSPSSQNATGMPPDANAARIWVQSADTGRWRLLLRPQQLDQLKQVLEPRGSREGGLHAALLRVEGTVRGSMPGQPFRMPKSFGEWP